MFWLSDLYGIEKMYLIIAVADNGEAFRVWAKACCYKYIKKKKLGETCIDCGESFIYCPICGTYLGNKWLDDEYESKR